MSTVRTPITVGSEQPFRPQGRRRLLLPIEANHLRLPGGWQKVRRFAAAIGADGLAVLYAQHAHNNRFQPPVVSPVPTPVDQVYPHGHFPPPDLIAGAMEAQLFTSSSGVENYLHFRFAPESTRSERLRYFIEHMQIAKSRKEAALQVIEENRSTIDAASEHNFRSPLLARIKAHIPKSRRIIIDELWQAPPAYETDRHLHVPLPWVIGFARSRVGRLLRNAVFIVPVLLYFHFIPALVVIGLGYALNVVLRHPLFNVIVNFFRLRRYNQVDFFTNLIPPGGIKQAEHPRFEFKDQPYRFLISFLLNLPGIRQLLTKAFNQPIDKANWLARIIQHSINCFEEIEVSNYFPTTIGYPHHRGWLSSNNVFRLREEYTPMDLADLVQYAPIRGLDYPTSTAFWVGPHPELPGCLTWAPKPPQGATGWRQIKNGGLGLLKIRGVDGKDQQIVVPLSNIPHRLQNPRIARQVVEMVPAGDPTKLEVVEANVKGDGRPSDAKADYYLSPSASLSRLAAAQGCEWSDSLLEDADFVNGLTIRVKAGDVQVTEKINDQKETEITRVTIVPQSTGRLTAATRFYVELEWRSASGEVKRFVVPRQAFLDRQDKPLLQNHAQGLSQLADIYQRENSDYNDQTAEFKPVLGKLIPSGRVVLRLTRVKRYLIDRPAEISEALKALGKTEADLAGVLYAMPTMAAKINNKFWIPYSLTDNVKARYLRNVAPLQYNYVFTPRQLPSRDPARQEAIQAEYFERLERLHQALEGKKSIPVTITASADGYKVKVKEGLEIEASELVDQHLHELLSDPRMAWARESILNNNGEWEISLFRYNKAVVLGVRKLKTNLGAALPVELPFNSIEFNNLYLHFVARQTLLCDEDIPGSFAADIRDSFFYGRGANYQTDRPNGWRNTAVGTLADMFHFFAGLQAGEANNFNANGQPVSAAIENGTRYVGSFRTLDEFADFLRTTDGMLGGVFHSLVHKHFQKKVNYGRELGHVQAVGEDEELKQSVMLLLGAALGYSFLDPSLALQEDSFGAINIQDCIKYIATTDLVAPAIKRVILETYHGRMLGNRPVSITRGQVWKLIMQATWYYVSYAEKNRKLAPMLFLLSAGYILPLPVDRATFMAVFLVDTLGSALGYQFLRIVQGNGFWRAFISAPAKDLAYLGAASQGIQRLFPEKWEYGPFTTSRSQAGNTEMPAHSKNLLTWYSMGEAASILFGAGQAATGATLKDSTGTTEGLVLNCIWAAYAFALSRTGRGWQKALERYEVFRKAGLGELPLFGLSTPTAKINLSDPIARRQQFLTWRYEAIDALEKMDKYIAEYRKKGKLPRSYHKFLRSEYRQSILGMVQQIDMGLFLSARELGGSKKAADRVEGFALLQMLCEDSADQAVYRLSSDALKKANLSKPEKAELAEYRKTFVARIEAVKAAVQDRPPLPNVEEESGILFNQVYSSLVGQTAEAGSAKDKQFTDAFTSFAKKMKYGRSFPAKIMGTYRAVLAKIRAAYGAPGLTESQREIVVDAALNDLLAAYPNNYLCRLLLKKWLEKDPAIRQRIATILAERVEKIGTLAAMKKSGQAILTMANVLAENKAIDAKPVRAALDAKLNELLANTGLKAEDGLVERSKIIAVFGDDKTWEQFVDKPGDSLLKFKAELKAGDPTLPADAAKREALIALCRQARGEDGKLTMAEIKGQKPGDSLLDLLPLSLSAKSGKDLMLVRGRAEALLAQLDAIYQQIVAMPEQSADQIELKLKRLGAYDELYRALLDLKYVAEETYRPTLAREKIFNRLTGGLLKHKLPLNSTFNSDEFVPAHNAELNLHAAAIAHLERSLRAELVKIEVEKVQMILTAAASPAERYQQVQAELKFIHQYNLIEVFDEPFLNAQGETEALYTFLDPLVDGVAYELGREFAKIHSALASGETPIAKLAGDFDKLTQRTIDLGFTNIIFKEKWLKLREQIEAKKTAAGVK